MTNGFPTCEKCGTELVGGLLPYCPKCPESDFPAPNYFASDATSVGVPTCGSCGLAMTHWDAAGLEFVCRPCAGVPEIFEGAQLAARGELTCPFCARLVEYDATPPIVENLARVADLEGAIDELLIEIKYLRRWREAAWQVMRETKGAREIMEGVETRLTGNPEASEKSGGKQ